MTVRPLPFSVKIIILFDYLIDFSFFWVADYVDPGPQQKESIPKDYMDKPPGYAAPKVRLVSPRVCGERWLCGRRLKWAFVGVRRLARATHRAPRCG